MVLICAIYVLAMGFIDLRSPKEMSFGIFYLIAVSMAAWFVGHAGGLVVAVLAVGTWLYVDNIKLSRQEDIIIVWNCISRLGILGFFAVALARVRELQDGLQSMVEKRTRQLEAETAQRIAVEREISAISHREQQRIGHELHDNLGQYLAAVAFRAKALEQSLVEQKVTQAGDAHELTDLISDAIKQARMLARGLDPIDLENGDLTPALQNLAAEAQGTFKINCALKAPPAGSPVRVDPKTGLALYRICQEALHNAISHGEARNAQIDLSVSGQTLHLRIKDDGKGFDMNSRKSNGMGLRIMKHRAASIDADLKIISAPQEGTQVDCRAPFAQRT